MIKKFEQFNNLFESKGDNNFSVVVMHEDTIHNIFYFNNSNDAQIALENISRSICRIANCAPEKIEKDSFNSLKEGDTVIRGYVYKNERGSDWWKYNNGSIILIQHGENYEEYIKKLDELAKKLPWSLDIDFNELP